MKQCVDRAKDNAEPAAADFFFQLKVPERAWKSIVAWLGTVSGPKAFELVKDGYCLFEAVLIVLVWERRYSLLASDELLVIARQLLGELLVLLGVGTLRHGPPQMLGIVPYLTSRA